MAESTIVTWSPANWITVVLMVALAYFLIGMVVRVVQQKQAQKAGS